jgi:hypothetical protein
MNTAYVVTRGAPEKRLLEFVLPPEMRRRTRFVEARGNDGAESRASSLAASERRPVALVLSAATSDAAEAEAERLQARRLLQSRALARVNVFVFVPETEVVFFYNASLLEAVAGCAVDEAVRRRGRMYPRAVLDELLDGVPTTALWDRLFEHLDEDAAARLREQDPFAGLVRFLDAHTAAYATIETSDGSTDEVLDAILEEMEAYMNHTRLHYTGIVSGLGRGSGPSGRTDRIRLHLRPDIAREDAPDLVRHALAKALRARGLAHRRDDLTVTLHDETGDEVPVPA